jgi:hypothetical protein
MTESTGAGPSEKEMREAEAPSPSSIGELADYIEQQVQRTHDYGTCVYAMSLAATAAFNYVAHRLGVTGFQASCADLDIVRRTRRIDGPFMLIKGQDMLYPQYDLHRRLTEALTEWAPWAAAEAKKQLDSTLPEQASPDVVAHWRQLIADAADAGGAA